jgi:hypothetical protein
MVINTQWSKQEAQDIDLQQQNEKRPDNSVYSIPG